MNSEVEGSPRIAIVNYGVGNLFSIASSLRRVGADPFIVSSLENVIGADALVLPGVGAFDSAMSFLDTCKIPLRRMIEEGKPLLGICLGMQVLFERSEEGGGGLKILKGRVVRLPSKVKVPHMGWNTVKIRRTAELVRGLRDEGFFYFVHSYVPMAEEEDTVGTTDYGLEFASIVAKDRVYGVQFHPEKSGKNGLRLLKNFVEVARRS